MRLASTTLSTRGSPTRGRIAPARRTGTRMVEASRALVRERHCFEQACLDLPEQGGPEYDELLQRFYAHAARSDRLPDFARFRGGGCGNQSAHVLLSGSGCPRRRSDTQDRINPFFLYKQGSFGCTRATIKSEE